MRFLVRNPYAQDRDALVRQLEDSFAKIRAYEQQAFQNHQTLAAQLVMIFGDRQDNPNLQDALRISQENQDAIRALLQVGDFYKELVKTNSHIQRHHELLLDLYAAIILVMIDSRDSLQEALAKLEAMEGRKWLSLSPLETLPGGLRPWIRLERLRYLTYISAQLGNCESGSEAGQSGSSSTCRRMQERQLNYTRQAQDLRRKLLPREPPATAAEAAARYRNLWYWIDLSDLTLKVKSFGTAPTQMARAQQRNEADQLFKELLSGAGCDPAGNQFLACSFLRNRMLRHRDVLPRDPQKPENVRMQQLWQSYVAHIPAARAGSSATGK
ncbi:MAG: hypothetical protein VKI81_05835 [Synechococcaceae cyanobacterium]|nr:hypothetical protein [Synechococcaceae cyanobacterium]